MAILLVTYDLNKPGQDYKDFIEAFKKYEWARLSESSYAIETTKSPETIYNELVPHIDKDDRVYIITLTRPLWYWGSKKVNEWLEARL